MGALASQTNAWGSSAKAAVALRRHSRHLLREFIELDHKKEFNPRGLSKADKARYGELERKIRELQRDMPDIMPENLGPNESKVPRAPRAMRVVASKSEAQ